MANFQGISATIFDEPEYRNGAELLLAIYIITEMDNAGVCRINHRRMALACKTSVPRIRTILQYFTELGKCIPSPTGKHLWWKSAIFHKLYQGKHSPKQLQNVVNLLSKWEASGEWLECHQGVTREQLKSNQEVTQEQPESYSSVCSNKFAALVAQHYATKYSLVIPIPNGTVKVRNTDSYSHTHTHIKAESKRVSNETQTEDDGLGPGMTEEERKFWNRS